MAGPRTRAGTNAGHGTAFKTRWMADALYQVASFMVLRRPTVWRWSHSRHHTDTIIVGRDPEIVAPRPPDFLGLALNFFNLKGGAHELAGVIRNACGRLGAEEATFIPEMERPKVFREARIWLAIYAVVIAAALATGAGCR